jgi:hypothetical protein
MVVEAEMIGRWLEEQMFEQSGLWMTPVGTMYVIDEGILRDRTTTNNDSVIASL